MTWVRLDDNRPNVCASTAVDLVKTCGGGAASTARPQAEHHLEAPDMPSEPHPSVDVYSGGL